MPRRIKVDSLESMCIDNICKNMESYWYEKYWKSIYSSRKRLLSEFGPFEYLPRCLVNKITEKLNIDPRFGIDVLSSLITSSLVKLQLPEYSALGRTIFDLISIRCQDTLKELTMLECGAEKSDIMRVIKSLKKLEVLNLERTDIDDGVLAVVGSNCSELSFNEKNVEFNMKLSLKGCHKITDVSMEYLFVNESTEDGLNSYGNCKMIESLNIKEMEIGVRGVETVLRNAPNLMNLDHPDVCLVLGKMHGNDFKSNKPLVQYSLTNLHAEDYHRSCGLENLLTNTLSVAIRVCPQLMDVILNVKRSAGLEVVFHPLCQLKNLKNLSICGLILGQHDVLFPKLVPVLSALGQSITRLHLKRIPSADVRIINICCPLLEDFSFIISDVYGFHESRKETFIPATKNKRPFAFLKFLDVSAATSYYGIREDFDIWPSEWRDLLSSRLLESLSIDGSSSLTDSLLSEALKDGQEFPNLRKLELEKCPNITAGFVKSFLDLQNPLEEMDVKECKNVSQSDLDALKSFCKLNRFNVVFHYISSDDGWW